jgi:filamentous hemagglutinin family protein
MKRLRSIVGLMSLVAIGYHQGAIAQVTSDGSLTTPTLVPPSINGKDFLINNGTRSGNNLFHSFSQFSIPTTGSAIFNNATDIQNIFSRVTGSQVSNIDGILKTQGNASLFLMNPNGILFGPNAKLDLGGSFIGTTASSIKFEDGIEFSAVNTTANPLLSVKVPIGLQMGTNPGAITNQGTTLEVPSGNTLALVGGDIAQIGGQLRVDGGGGRIELASLGENSQVGINAVAGGWSFDTRNVQNFRDLQFTQKANVDGSGNASATINAVGRNFVLSDNSRFQGYNRGDLAGGAIAVNASSSILVQESSDIRTDVDGAGNAGNVSISAPKITLYNQGSIVSVAWKGIGKAGDLLLQGKEITLTSDPRFVVNDVSTKGSAIVTLTFDKGQSGNIKVLADTLTYANGGGFANITFGQGNSGVTTLISKTMTVRNSSGGGAYTNGTGNGGDVNITTDSFYMDGSSGYFTGSYGKEGGRAGNINVTARSIIARDDSGFGSDTFGRGNAGDITFKADYIELDEAQLNTRTSGSGNGGKIDLSAQTLRILNGAQLNVATKAAGNGGSIIINAKTVELNGESTRGIIPTQNTGIMSSVLPDPKKPDALTGKGGNIDLTSSSLVIRDGALISASTSAGAGNGGNIELHVNTLDVWNGGQIMNITRKAGNGGTITINARDRIFISGRDALYTERQAAYIPNQDTSDVEYNIGPFSGIYANATTEASGAGGNLQITGNELRLQDGARVTVSSQGTGSAGNLMGNLNTLRLDQQASLQAEATAGSKGNLLLNIAQALILRNGSTITTNAIGTANGGNITINSPIILGLENSDIIANAIQGLGGNININTQSMIGLKFRNTRTPRTDLTNDITASSEFSLNGNVSINTIGINPTNLLHALPVDIVDSSHQMSDICGAAKTSSFVATGRGGIPQNPMKKRSSDRSWHDLRTLTFTNPVTTQPTITENPISRPIVEANAFQIDESGAIALVAKRSPMSVNSYMTCSLGNDTSH